MTILDINNLSWTIPGVVFIFLYNNKFRPNNSINVSGWSYIFCLVIVAHITWMPISFILNTDKMNCNPFNITVSTILISTILSALLAFFCKRLPLLSQIQDNFYIKCLEWHRKAILLTLKNGKSYIGILWKYPENPKSRHESQTISIVPQLSGYRTEKQKINWNTIYPEYYSEKKEDNYLTFEDMELIIPRTEIISFAKFNGKAFESFVKKDN